MGSILCFLQTLTFNSVSFHRAVFCSLPVPSKLRKTTFFFFFCLDFPKSLLFPQGFLCNSQFYRMFCKIDSYDSISVSTCPSVHYQGYVIVYFIFHVSFSVLYIYWIEMILLLLSFLVSFYVSTIPTLIYLFLLLLYILPYSK